MDGLTEKTMAMSPEKQKPPQGLSANFPKREPFRTFSFPLPHRDPNFMKNKAIIARSTRINIATFLSL